MIETDADLGYEMTQNAAVAMLLMAHKCLINLDTARSKEKLELMPVGATPTSYHSVVMAMMTVSGDWFPASLEGKIREKVRIYHFSNIILFQPPVYNITFLIFLFL